MRAVITMKPDTLDEDTIRFAPDPIRESVFLNSIPKSGSHLLRNILRMFVPIEQQYRAQFIQWPNLAQHLGAFDPAKTFMSFGHLFFTDGSAIELSHTRKILLYRDPHSWVLARARFHLSDEFQGNLDHLKDGRISADDLITLMIFGIRTEVPSLSDMYDLNVVAWLGSDVYPVRYEDLVHHVRAIDEPEAETYFRSLLDACGIGSLPENWRERVLVGSNPKQSGTARENLTGIKVEFPKEIADKHKNLIEYIAPGLRSVLGYADA